PDRGSGRRIGINDRIQPRLCGAKRESCRGIAFGRKRESQGDHPEKCPSTQNSSIEVQAEEAIPPHHRPPARFQRSAHPGYRDELTISSEEDFHMAHKKG